MARPPTEGENKVQEPAQGNADEIQLDEDEED